MVRDRPSRGPHLPAERTDFSARHRFAFLRSRLGDLGIRAGTPSASLVGGKTGTVRGDGPPVEWWDPILVPAHGGRDVPADPDRGGRQATVHAALVRGWAPFEESA